MSYELRKSSPPVNGGATSTITIHPSRGKIMKYGAMNFPIKPLLREIEEIGEMGFDYVELTMDPPEATPQKMLGQKRAILEVL